METFIRKAAHRGGSALWSRHAIARLVVHHLSREEVEISLEACRSSRSIPMVTARCRTASCWHGFMWASRSMLSSQSMPRNDRVFVVTVYRPDPARWFDDWTRRRS